jgi:hypothetical protein
MNIARELDYEPKEQASASLALALSLPFARKRVGQSSAYGIQSVFFGFLALETYTADSEPLLDSWPGLRLVLWKTSCSKKSPGWRRWLGIPIGNTRAVALVEEDYQKKWSSLAKRNIRHHRKQGFCYREISLETFARLYHKYCHLDPLLRHGFIRITKDHIRVHSENVKILFVTSKKKVLLGGAVFVHFPDIKVSHYLLSFLTPEGKKSSTGYAFIDWWYQDMLAQGIVWADLGIIWQPGDPVSWKGYSTFKERFRPEKKIYKTYWRATWRQ